MECELVERSSGRTSSELTSAGLLLVERAQQILAELDAAAADLRAIAEQDAPTLRVGGYESVAASILPGALKRLVEVAPTLTVRLKEDPEWSRFFPLVASGELDAAFADLPLGPGPFAHRELMRDPCVLVVHRDSPLASRDDPPTLAEIGALPLIVGSWPMTRLITEHFRAAGVEPKFPYTADLNAEAQSLVAEGLGAHLYPRLSVVEDPRLAVVPLDGILPARRIVLYWHRRRKQDQEIRQLVAALLAQCEQIQREIEARSPSWGGRRRTTPATGLSS